MYGIFRAAACVPFGEAADVEGNLRKHLDLALKAAERRCSVALFPEMSLTCYSCGDLFHHPLLLKSAEDTLQNFRERTACCSTVFVIGLPVRIDGRVFNGAAVIQRGHCRGIALKTHLPNTAEFQEKRFFSEIGTLPRRSISFAGEEDVPVGNDLIFQSGKLFRFGIEICYDMFSAVPHSGLLSLGGANLILNPAASTEHAGKASVRVRNVRNLSANSRTAYLYASCGAGESTTDTVCGGHCIGAECGNVLLNSPRFRRTDTIDMVEFDLSAVDARRMDQPPFGENGDFSCRMIPLDPVPDLKEEEITLVPDAHPFIPADPTECNDLCEEYFMIQASALAKRIEHVRAKRLVIGVSGGLDSTLALLVCARALELLNRPADHILAVTMPGFGTTERTFSNAGAICREIGAELREIPIREACKVHFSDIGLDPSRRDAAYENSQARERTQILLDLANSTGGICIGTGDLSECALGWCTFNGDHIAMYGVNASVPKSLMRKMILWYAAGTKKSLAEPLKDIVATPVSPELLPADEAGAIAQKTEEILGPYDVHDFLIYRMMISHDAPEKLFFLVKRAFPEIPPEDLKKYLQTFLRRFFSQQFKRNCSTEAPGAGPVSFSPRGGLVMASDVNAALWNGVLK